MPLYVQLCAKQVHFLQHSLKSYEIVSLVYNFKKEKRLNDHQKKCGKSKTCDVCQKEFKTSDHLKRHMQTHIGGKKCNECGKELVSCNHYKDTCLATVLKTACM